MTLDATFQRLLDDGELVPVATFLERTGLTEQALSQATRDGRLFFLEVRVSRPTRGSSSTRNTTARRWGS